MSADLWKAVASGDLRTVAAHLAPVHTSHDLDDLTRTERTAANRAADMHAWGYCSATCRICAALTEATDADASGAST